MNASLEGLMARRNEHRVLGLMLLLLHLAMWWDFGSALSRSLMLAHLGLFLIWQPVWSRDQRLAWRNALLFIGVTIGFIVWLDWWPMAFWLTVLIGLVGARANIRRTDRYAHMGALVFLVSDLLIGCVPPMFSLSSVGAEVQTLLGYALIALSVGIFFVPVEGASEKHVHSVDFLYGLTVSLLTIILALGALLITYDSGVDYAVALFKSILGIALFLIVISWLWDPPAGIGGLGQLWQRYLLNIGTPFERWLADLAHLAQGEASPEGFLRSSAERFVELPWAAGIEWKTPDGEGSLGETTPHSFDVKGDDLEIIIFAHHPVSVGLLLHGRLLIQIVVHFYRAKKRERELAQRAHLQAVHETGARVTHDIKNLLQSLHTMTTAAQQSQEGRNDELQLLMQKQLPHVTQRLQLALDKLQAPERAEVSECRLEDWWETLKARHSGRDIRFESQLTSNPLIPADLFDSVAENLLENARIKCQLEPEIGIDVKLVSDVNGSRLLVTDTGSAVDVKLARKLFKAPVNSKSGLGIGLYQAARQAEQLGYALSLRCNDVGNVCFELGRVELS